MRLFYIALISFFILSVSRADVHDFSLSMDGAQAGTGSSATGGETVPGCTYDTDTNILTLNFEYSGLTSNTNNAHIHGPAAPNVNAPVVFSFPGFTFGATSGSYSNTFSLTGAQETDLMNNLYYVNIHTINFGAGEIRGQLIDQGALPVELSSFTARHNHLDVVLEWRTETEVNNYGFEVERKRSQETGVRGQNENQWQWEKAGFVKGSGNSNLAIMYEFSDKNLTPGKYSYRLKQVDNDGSFEYSIETEIEIIAAPIEFNLAQNYPNPFNPLTNIQYSIPKGQASSNQFVSIKVYNNLGKEVATLVNENKEAGVYEIKFNGSILASGVYYYTLKTEGYTDTKKFMILK